MLDVVMIVIAMHSKVYTQFSMLELNKVYYTVVVDS